MSNTKNLFTSWSRFEQLTVIFTFILPLCYRTDLGDGAISPRTMLIGAFLVVGSVLLAKSPSVNRLYLPNLASLGFSVIMLLSFAGIFYAWNTVEATVTFGKWALLYSLFYMFWVAFRRKELSPNRMLHIGLAWAVGIFLSAGIALTHPDSDKLAFTFGHENMASFAMGILVIWGVAFGSKKNWWILGIAVLAIGVIGFNGTRSVWVALPLALIAWVLAKSSVRGARIFGFIVLAGALLMGFLAPLIQFNHLPESFQSRIYLWENSREMISDNPMLGVGGGNWKVRYGEFGLDKFGVEVYSGAIQAQRAHNEYLQVASEMGIVGLIGLAIIIGAALFYGPKVNGKAGEFATAVVVYFIAVNAFSFPLERPSLYVFLAMVLALSYRDSKALALTWNSNWGLYKLVVLGALIIGFTWMHMQGEQSAEKARIAFSAKNMEGLMKFGRKSNAAFNLDYSATPLAYYAGMGYVLQNRWDSAVALFDEAIKANPNHLNMRLNAGFAAFSNGEISRAEGHYRYALSLSSKFHKASVSLSELYLYQSNYDSAHAVLSRVPYYLIDTDYHFQEMVYRTEANRIYNALSDTYPQHQVAAFANNKAEIFSIYRYAGEQGVSDPLNMFVKAFKRSIANQSEKTQ